LSGASISCSGGRTETVPDVTWHRRRLPEYEFVYFYPPARALVPMPPEAVFARPLARRAGEFRPALYVHVPFCTGRCTYCHYTRWTLRRGDRETLEVYLTELEREMVLVTECMPFAGARIDALHVGGGTPSVLTCDQIRRLMASVKRNFCLSNEAEITWEASPETLLDGKGEKVDSLLACGVNRLNIGAQSFEDPLLKVAGRRHSAADVARVFEMARGKGFRNINVDLIYGLPRQTPEHWEHTLDVLGQLLPESVTCYQLRLKVGTPMAQLAPSQFPDEGTCLQMRRQVLDKLAGFGYRPWQPNQFVLQDEYIYRYLRSKWRGPAEVVGIGVSAYSFVNNCMYMNCRALDEYYSRVRVGQLPILIGKKLSRQQEMAKAVVLGIKVLPDGVDKKGFMQRFGVSVESVYGQTLARLEAAGVVDSTSEHLRLTRDGLLFADEVCVALYAEEDKEALKEAGASRYGAYLDVVS